jgi:hypothetical protein
MGNQSGPLTRESRLTQADWDAVAPAFALRESVFLALVGARYEDGGHVLSTEDALVLTTRVLAAIGADHG